MTRRKTILTLKSRYIICGILVALIVLIAIAAMIRNHSLCGYWLSSENRDFVFVDGNGQCQFKLSEYSGGSVGRFRQEEGIECYKAEFIQRQPRHAVLLRGSPKIIFFGVAKADVVELAPWYDPSVYGCYVLNIARLLQASCIIIFVPFLFWFGVRMWICQISPEYEQLDSRVEETPVSCGDDMQPLIADKPVDATARSSIVESTSIPPTHHL